MYNIRQITNYSIPENTPVNIYDDIEYIKLNKTILGGEIVKFGYYINSPGGIRYPLYYSVNGKKQKIKLDKKGFYEINVEKYYDTSKQKQETIKVRITEIEIPKNVEFSLDYVIDI